MATMRKKRKARTGGRHTVVRESSREWPGNYVGSFAGIPEDFARLPQGTVEERKKLSIACAREVVQSQGQDLNKRMKK